MSAKHVHGNLCVQVDTMEMMRHPGETTNMRRQTVASYFRVRLFIYLFIMLAAATLLGTMFIQTCLVIK